MPVIQLDDHTWENPAVTDVDPHLTLPKMMLKRLEEHPGDIIVERRNTVGAWQEVSVEQFVDHMYTVARGLIGLGLRQGDALAILAPTCYEWAVWDMAALSCGAITVPIYETDSAVQIRHILEDAHVSVVMTETSQQADLVQSVRTSGVHSILSLDRGAEVELARAAQSVDIEEVRTRIDAGHLHDLATIIYTSGTTGKPKGVELTHSNFISSFIQAYDFLPNLVNNPQSRTLLFLPVAHVLARFVMHALLTGQGRIGFSPNTNNLVNDLATFQPTLMLVVPRVLEKVFNAASTQAGGGLKGRIFSWSAKQARLWSQVEAQHGHHVPFLVTLRRRIADALVLHKVRKILGPNMHSIICGGAPLALDLANFYRGVGITLLQGYGLSESTGPITVEIPSDFPPDSVGFPWPGNALRIASDGELLIRGVCVTPGYHHLPEETAAAFKDGWFCTGDLASIDPEGRLKITGRKKELIVTAGGKNVSPEILEDALRSHPLIGQLIVVGDGRPYIGALIVLDDEMLPAWLKSKGLPVMDPVRAAQHPAVRDSLDKAIARANRKVSRAESIRRYRVIDAQFTVDNGYLTPSLKLKRNLVLKDFADQIDAMYAEGERSKNSPH